MAKQLKATEVFTPGAFPQYTYVERDEGREQRLRDALSVPGYVVSVSGPSKSGKTSLIERVVGAERLISVGGSRIGSPAQLWELVLDWMGAPAETTGSVASTFGVDAQGGAKVEGNALVAKGDISGSVTGKFSRLVTGTEKRMRGGMNQVAKEIAESDFVILVDDFHYMSKEVQQEVAKQLKEAVRLGIKVVTASVPYRADDVVRANPELRGRVVAIDMKYWEPTELVQIAQIGFEKLNAVVETSALERFATESAGSPQLMQAVCLHACFHLGLREAQSAQRLLPAALEEQALILEQTASTTDFRSLVDMLETGPRTRGTERKTFSLSDGTAGDVYRCVLKAMAAQPLRLSFDYDELLRRVRATCVGDAPVGSSVTTTCDQMCRIAANHAAPERVLDWDEGKAVLDVANPYLMFYLRWSRRLDEVV